LTQISARAVAQAQGGEQALLLRAAIMPPETPPEDAISIDPEQVCFIIIKAKELDAKV
jgi:hypothetical protein